MTKQYKGFERGIKMTDKQIVKDFLGFLNKYKDYTIVTDIAIYDYETLRRAIINCLNQAMEDGSKKTESEALFDVSVSQIQKDW